MFTGIISAIGKLSQIQQIRDDCQLKIETGKLSLQELKIGDNIAVDGVSLVLVEVGRGYIITDVSKDNLSKTTFANASLNSLVNLELALTPTTGMGGHIVSGLVDGTARIIEKTPDGRGIRFSFRAPDTLAKYIAINGFVCVNGVSLSVNQLNGTVFSVNLQSMVLQETTFGHLLVGMQVNLEVDLLSRYVERLMQTNLPVAEYGVVTKELLQKNGFLSNEYY
jgi:riboflavin synthase